MHFSALLACSNIKHTDEQNNKTISAHADDSIAEEETMSVNYEYENTVSHITIDDGKVNALSSRVINQIQSALDEAQSNRSVTILTGNERLFSAGFDLSELASNKTAAANLVRCGAELCLRLLSFPYPIVSACNGHAFPMGAFLLMSSDYRIGVDGPFLLGMNEVKIGMAVPRFAIELARGRLHPAYFHRTVATGELFSPDEALIAGILDELVAPELLATRALEKAEELKSVNFSHHFTTKLCARTQWIAAVKQGIVKDYFEWGKSQPDDD